MSLINKMLQDLEARDKSDPAAEKPAYEDLHSVALAKRKSSTTRPILWAVLAVVLISGLVAGGIFVVDNWPAKNAPAAATPAPIQAVLLPDPVKSETPAPANTPLSPAAGQTSQPVPEIPPVVRLKPQTLSPPVAPSRALPESPKPANVPPPASAPARSEPVKASKSPSAQSFPIGAAPVAGAASKPQVPKLQTPTATNKAVMEKTERPLSPVEQADAYYVEAGQLISQGRMDNARATLAAALTAWPGHVKARELAAAVALQNGRTREAQSLLEQGIKLSPQHLPFTQLLARLLVDQGDESQAITILEKARSAAPVDTGHLSFLAALYQRAGRNADAAKTYREAVSMQAQDARAWLGLGISLEATQDVPGAIDAYTHALAVGGLEIKLAQYAQQRLSALKK